MDKKEVKDKIDNEYGGKNFNKNLFKRIKQLLEMK